MRQIINREMPLVAIRILVRRPPTILGDLNYEVQSACVNFRIRRVRLGPSRLVTKEVRRLDHPDFEVILETIRSRRPQLEVQFMKPYSASRTGRIEPFGYIVHIGHSCI